MTHLLEFKDLAKSFFGVPAVRKVDLTLNEGEILCLVGENGAGKSTLMNMLGGVHQPDEGLMRLRGEEYKPTKPADATAAGIAFIHQELNLFGNLSIAENIAIDRMPRYSGIPLVNRKAMHNQAREVMKQVGLDLSPNVKVDSLAPGEKQLVEIAKALAADAKLIILDEPTTSLTNRETEVLFVLLEKLRAEGRSLIYISHVLSDVMRLADQIVVLRDGERIGGGPVSDFDIPKMISTMVGRPLQQLFPERPAKELGEPVLEVANLSEPGIVKNINLAVRRGEVVGIYGLMGAGRTELARIIFGLDPHQEGTVSIAGKQTSNNTPRQNVRNGLAFVTEDRRHEGLLMDNSIIENMGLVGLRRFAKGGVISQSEMEKRTREMASQLRLRAGDSTLSQPVRSLSGGNQQKVVIGKWIIENPDVLIVDEPTRGIDVGAKFEVFTIMNELAAGGAGILYISSEIEELMGMADRIIVMHQGMMVKEFTRNAFNETAILAAAFGKGEAA